MQHRGRPRTRQVVAEAPTPVREQVDESVNVPESSAHPQPSQSVRPKPTLGPIPGQMEQMAQILAAAFQEPRESGISIKRACKLGAKPYDGSGDPERALSWIEANKEIFQMIGCTKEQRVSYFPSYLKIVPRTGGRRIREHTQRVSYGWSSRENLQRDFFLKAIKMPKLKSFIDWRKGTPQS